MKQNIFTSLLLLLSITASAQNKKQTITITTKLGKVYTYVVGETIDSTRVIEGVGIKVYPKGKTVSEDFLFSQIEYTITENVTPNPDPTDNNANRNTADDLQKNREGWRLEFPRFYQGTNKTHEVTHYTTEANLGKLRNYSIEWDTKLKANRWTCYELYDVLLQKNAKRQNAFQQDPEIPANEQTSPDDYSGSGFSRGHLCPSGDRLYSAAQNKQTFYLTNMQPQIQGHNGGVWGDLEKKVRDWAGRCDTLYIVKAATIDKDEYICKQADLDEMAQKESSGKSLHFNGIVPKFFYMALLAYDKKTNTYRALGIWSPHYNNSKSEYITIQELQNRTGIDFFCNLSDDIEQAVETTIDQAYWGY
ncbi:MAG: DNA/RNA non-specific endonuclease [Prevotella sp.]|uniref:DNA/RNA non-specific endonuclease n=1 Tax=Prevotella sp. TaxID=59823 RepID=UPI001CACA9E0|nr:DNA/RNA non-specific endonuclease [Prevotella sp.]MBF1620985.1 DNA/RNA non-specific endonuclease [Prevotella sp.]